MLNQAIRAFKSWQYRGGRPQRWARVENRLWAILFAAGIMPKRAAALEVRGRKSGRLISFPVAIADYEGERYLVAMLGEKTNWVRNARAADGRCVLRHGRREDVRLVEVFSDDRAAILRRYLQVAPGARPHFPVDRRAPLEEFERIVGRYPVFRITTAPSSSASRA
ncbi:nitroreductase/quinone reductase family protein [Micromonospora sp. NPDC050495]|uniref:nitroreductase/quinone reductase family protein n=1 Tax=Micromonospora sp. NPDC050495 TaxID=3154936 RepID=UPI0033C38DB2